MFYPEVRASSGAAASDRVLCHSAGFGIAFPLAELRTPGQKRGRNPKARPKSGGGNQMKIARQWLENLIGESLISSLVGRVNSFCRILAMKWYRIL
jgi:hypothetical protein